jgi:hypothetical protein
MADTNWIAVSASLLGGGAAGAIITTLVNLFRNRKQPVAYHYEMVPVFKGAMLGGSDVTATLNLGLRTGDYDLPISNLSVVNVEVVNSGNKDLTSFRFGLTLTDGDHAVHCDASTPDRHHKAEIIKAFDPADPTAGVDLEVVPFNRGDAYTFTLYVVVVDGKDRPGEIRLSSQEPVIFRKSPNIQELASSLASRFVIQVGGIKLFLR